ncbi:VOC family protein [Methylobacterium organophilum]|uniref:VOC domain-containing protein n=1 Tax=Methylobacterium organophilum TaxID=410 RepID=A0ABQ4TCN1_METOR|nr:VOC family protein [Methylobacterium organophilum]GJE28082.1 hypothetical protein LKMONMHP_2946 [Methylobacterium organophilum]
MPRAEIIPYLFYRDVPTALDWLARAFGFIEESRHPTPSGGLHAEMRLEGCRIMMGQAAGQGTGAERIGPPAPGGRATQGVFVYLPDLTAHFAAAKAAGAEIPAEPADHGYGLTYTAYDLDGHPWYFTQMSG